MDLTVLAAGVLLILAVLSVRLSERLQMPVLLLFLGLGMAAGSEGPGGIAFDSPDLAQSVGTVCLVVILFAGGLDTAWSSVRSVVGPGLLLATGGVLVSTLILGTAAWWLLGSYTDLRLGGDGISFLAVYLCGLVLGNRVRSHRRLIIQVSDALAWIAQIAMFITMGLLVFPSELVGVAPVGIVLALILMFLARPVSVFLCLLPSGFSARESAYVSWAGLRGAVPVVLATFPATAGLAQAGDVFGVVFFLVVVSVLVQGFTLGPVGRRFGIEEPVGPPT